MQYRRGFRRDRGVAPVFICSNDLSDSGSNSVVVSSISSGVRFGRTTSKGAPPWEAQWMVRSARRVPRWTDDVGRLAVEHAEIHGYAVSARSWATMRRIVVVAFRLCTQADRATWGRRSRISVIIREQDPPGPISRKIRTPSSVAASMTLG